MISEDKFSDGIIWAKETRPEQSIRNSDWTILSTPSDLADRRVEITGPPVKKMIINALNSGANTFMADFEDSLSPTWQNITEGQFYLYKANIHRTHLYVYK